MMNKFLDIIKSIVWPLIATLFVFCFAQKIDELLVSFNNKWMANCNEIAGGWAIIVLVVLMVLHLVLKNNNTQLSLSHLCWLVCLIIVYYHFRTDETYRFWSFSVADLNIAYTDLFAVPLFVLLVIQIITICNKSKLTGENGLIDKDEPIKIEDKDLLGYGTIVNGLAKELKLLDLNERSFSIGVAGGWGMGKSSFFNLLETAILEDDKDAIIIKFNPRSSTNVKEIQNDFFETFSAALAPYNYSIARDMRRYQDALKLPEQNFVVRLLRLLPSLITDNGKKAINRVIKVIKRRIYVLIDDFDRLTAEEILEVMKVIDRNGDFRQTVFITAYDKEYVNNVLKEYLGHGKKETYTDKYFTYEIKLPIQSKEVLHDYVRNAISEKIKTEETDTIKKEQLLSEWDGISHRVSQQLHTLRHAKRFMNDFLIRYNQVRNDVYFSDFIRVSLLRYFDIGTYYALIEGKLTKGGGLFSGPFDKVLYQVDDLEAKLKECSQWEGSKTIVEELVEKQTEHDYELTSKYKRLRWRDSFACYFYDYQPGGVYHKDLIKLYEADNEDDSINVLHELLKYDKDKNAVDQSRYVTVENFLRARPITELRNEHDVTRLFNLLCYLNQFMGRSINIEASMYYLLGKGAEKELVKIIGGEYKQCIIDAIKHNLEIRPLSLAFVLGQMYDNMRKSDGDVNDYLFTQKEMKGFVEWSQKYYLSQVDNITPNNLEAVVTLSRIFEDSSNGKSVISQSAQHEFVAFISLHADEFVSSVVEIVKTQKGRVKLNIRIDDCFDPSVFFPCDGVDIQHWVKTEVNSMYLSYIFNRLLREEDRSMIVDLLPGDYGVDETDFSQVYNVVKAADEIAAEKKVMSAMKQQVANSIELLSNQTGIPKDEVRSAIQRMKQKGELNDTQADVAESIPAFKIGDFVRIKDNDLEKYQMAQGYAFNLYRIREIAESGVRLDDVAEPVSPDSIEAVPIDGVHDKKVYYDSIVAASIIPAGGKIPVHKTDYSYFMDKFKNCFDENNKTYADIVRECDYHFVHEVQHWLRKHGDDGLKTYTFGY